MLPRHRRHFSINGEYEPRRGGFIIRLILVLIVGAILWTFLSRLFSFFDPSVGKKRAAILRVQTEGVTVSLQNSDWQRGETNLQLYSGDSVRTIGSGDATIDFFEGTMVRLDRDTEVKIEDIENIQSESSLLDIRVTRGRIWISVPEVSTLTGSSTHIIRTEDVSVDIPKGSSALISESLLAFLRTSGIGATVSIPSLGKSTNIILGEGQYLNLNTKAKEAIAQGQDPYTFRDPLTQELLRDPFVITSVAQTNTVQIPEGNLKNLATENIQEDISILSPSQGQVITTPMIHVQGKVSDRITTVLVNNQRVPLERDQTFSAEIPLGSSATFSLKIEGQDVQGIPLAKVERTIKNGYQIVVAPVNILTPIGSGQVLQTQQPEVEITGTAPKGTSSIMVNDYRLQLYQAGANKWSYLASTSIGSLKQGKNVFTVYAIDANGNKSPGRSITIEYTPEVQTTSSVSSESDTPTVLLEAGSITVREPTNGSAINDNELSILGTTSPRTSSISVNGFTLSLFTPGSTEWKYIASTVLGTMHRGLNTYTIVSKNEKGEVLDRLIYTLTFRP